MVDFSKLKKKNTLETLTKKLEEQSHSTFQDKDTTYWFPTLDKAGNGSATIRFLPAPPMDPEDSLPWVKSYVHAFKGVGGWYIENSLTTINQADPVADYNSKLWDTNLEANREIVRKFQKRKKRIVSGIYVITDAGKPENEGKVFRFRYGDKIFAMLSLMMNGNSTTHPGTIEDYFDDVVPAFDPFNFWKGANLKLRVKKVEGYSNYDNSKFAKPSPLFNDDEKIEEVWKQQYSLQEILDPKNFRSYDELKTKLYKVLGKVDETGMGVENSALNLSAKPVLTRTTEKAIQSVVRDIPPWDEASRVDEDEKDTTLDYFQSLLKDT